MWNCDEAAAPYDGGTGKIGLVYADKKSTYVGKVAKGDKTIVTVHHTINAANEYLPPFIVLPGRDPDAEGNLVPVTHKLTDLDAYPEAKFVQTKSGWQKRETFLAYLKW